MQKNIKLSLILVALFSQLQAKETNTIILKPLDVTSTAIKTDELKSTDAVEIYTQDDIEKAHVQNIYEFLNKETSVITMPGYGNPFTQKIDMRGYGITDGYENIVITVNGRRLNNVDMVPQLLASISVESIERIEIIKSSGIVIGGDGANAGVINITTKKNNDKELSFYGGTYGAASGSFYLGHSDDKLSVSASGEAQKNDGIRYIDDENNKDKNNLSTGTFNLAYTPIEELELRAGASFAKTDVTYASFLTETEYNDDPTQSGATNWGATHQKYDSNVMNLGLSYYANDSLSLNVDTFREKKESEYVTYASIANYDYKTAKLSVDYVDDFLSLSAGIDMLDNNRQNTKNDIKKKNSAGYVMSDFQFKNSSIKAGYRYEQISFESKGGENQDDTLHGAELGYNYTLDNEKSLFVNYSHSYQSANLDRLFSWSTGEFMGYVEPSQANNYNIGFNYIIPTNKFKITAYYIDLKNEIYYHPDPTYVNAKNTNIDKSHKYGLDIYNKWLISDVWNVTLNYNFVQAIIDDEKEGSDDYSGNELPGVSNHNIKATLGYLPNKFTTIALSQIYRSEAYAADDFNNDFSQKQDAYNSTDISLTYAKKSWEVFAKINNLFNQKNGLWVADDAIYPVNFTTTALVGFKLKY